MAWADHTGSTDRRSLLSLTSGSATKAQRWGVLLSCQVSVLQSQRTHTQSARWHLPKPVSPSLLALYLVRYLPLSSSVCCIAADHKERSSGLAPPISCSLMERSATCRATSFSSSSCSTTAHVGLDSAVCSRVLGGAVSST